METNSPTNEIYNNVIFALQTYCEEREIDRNKFQIHLIEVEESQTDSQEEIINVTITLGSPGIFIGKGGREINCITNFLTMYLDKIVKIHLKEFNPWKPKFS